MKTILLWDPRFPDRRPARLTVEDTVASAAVRTGVAAAAHPAEADALSAGGALDPSMLTEVALQHGSGSATRRVFLPYSVVMVSAAAGVLASIGTPIPGGVTPTPTPTPTPTVPGTPTISVASGNAQNTVTIVDGADGGAAITAHKLYRGSAAGGEAFVGTIPIAFGLTYSDTQLTNGATYYYRVSAVNSVGDSPLSNSASGTPSAGSGLTANQQLLAAMPSRPLVAELGGSRERQNGAVAGTQTRSLPCGQLIWAEP